MPYFEYVSKEEVSRVKNELTKFINIIQSDIRDKFTFTYSFVGNSARNMVTTNYYSNIGYDYDVSIMVNNADEIEESQIVNILKTAFDKYSDLFKYNNIDDDKRVISIRLKDKKRSKLNHICDFGIHKKGTDESIQYLSYSKKNNKYSWVNIPRGIASLDHKIMWLKDNGYWQEVRDIYLEKRASGINKNKPTRLIFNDVVSLIFEASSLNN